MSNQVEALCMKCRDENSKPTKQMMNVTEVNEKNNRYSAKGTCTNCSGNMFKFMNKETAEATAQGAGIQVTQVAA